MSLKPLESSVGSNGSYHIAYEDPQVPNQVYTDQTFTVTEKPLGFIVGEQLRKLGISLTNFGSRVWNFQILPGATAQETPKEDEPPPKKVDDRKSPDMHEKIQKLNDEFEKHPHQIALLNNIVQPSPEMQFYQTATLGQMEIILARDFFHALKGNYEVNLRILKTIRLLSTNIEVYAKLLELHTSSLELHSTQLVHNRICETAFLDHAKKSFNSLKKLDAQVQNCNGKIENCETRVHEIVNKALAEAQNLYEVIETQSQSFLGEIKELEKQINEAIETIASSSKEVADTIVLLSKTKNAQERLEVKKGEIQVQFEAFQAAKAKEGDSTRVEKIGGGSITVMGYKLWETGPTYQIVEADFGSRSLYQAYVEIKRKSEKLENEVDKLSSELAEKLANVLATSFDDCEAQKEKLTEAGTSLAAALKEVHSLKQAVRFRKEQATVQKQLLQNRIQLGDYIIQDFNDVNYYIEILFDKLVNSHAIFIQSLKQSSLLEDLYVAETRLSHKITADIQSGSHDGMNAVDEELKLLGSDQLILRMPNNLDILDAIQEVLQ